MGTRKQTWRNQSLKAFFFFASFEDANLKLRKTQNLSRCMEGLKLLETYCQELLKAGARISQGEDVTSFFEAQSQDLDPSFPEDRYQHW